MMLAKQSVLGPICSQLGVRARQLTRSWMRTAEPDEQRMLDPGSVSHHELDDADVLARTLALEAAVNL